MKNYTLLFVFFWIANLNAQEAPKMPKYNAKNAANIFYYNSTEVPESIKIKKEAIENKTLKVLRDYNSKVKIISFLNTPELTDLEQTINTFGNQLFTDRELAERVQKQVETLILPLRDSIAVYETTLNDSLNTFLSKKQFKKWLKYQKLEKRKLLPERPKSRNNAAPPSNMNRRRGGMGMGGRGF